jgi:hypothetical protein
MAAPSPPGPTNSQVLLGLFIVWQLFFLVASNFIKLADSARDDLKDNAVVDAVAPGWTEKKGHVHDAEEVVSGVTTRWAQLTGQPQNWSLFSPRVADAIPFLGVELRWDDDRRSGPTVAGDLAPFAAASGLEGLTLAAGAWANRVPIHPAVYLPSDNEPANPRCFFRLGRFRLRKYESYLDVALTARDPQRSGQLDSWRDRIESKVRREADTMRAYLGWRLRNFQRTHPDLPTPTQVILRVRLYRIPKPAEQPDPWMWQDAQALQPYPVARYRPDHPPADEYFPVEMFNPVVERFEYLRR